MKNGRSTSNRLFSHRYSHPSPAGSSLGLFCCCFGSWTALKIRKHKNSIGSRDSEKFPSSGLRTSQSQKETRNWETVTLFSQNRRRLRQYSQTWHHRRRFLPRCQQATSTHLQNWRLNFWGVSRPIWGLTLLPLRNLQQCCCSIPYLVFYTRHVPDYHQTRTRYIYEILIPSSLFPTTG